MEDCALNKAFVIVDNCYLEVVVASCRYQNILGVEVRSGN